MFPIIDIDVPSKQVFSDLRATQRDMEQAVQEESVSIANLFVGGITDYPPEGSGNQPPPPYYSRGTGYIRRGGSISPTSERFGENVVYKITSSITEVVIRFTLKASYSNWLVGSFDQARVHALHGWKTIRTVLKGLNIDADETTSATVPATSGIRRAVNKATARLRKYS